MCVNDVCVRVMSEDVEGIVFDCLGEGGGKCVCVSVEG